MQVLKEKNVPATFFCVGDNIEKHPDLYKELDSAGHAVGNHTYHHLDGWRSTSVAYLQDIDKCQSYIQTSHPPLFRPPYGRINHKARREIAQNYKVIMWDVLMGDFDSMLDKDKAIAHCLEKLEDGSIVLFHDSLKAEKNMKYMLPRFLDQVSNRFTFSKLPWC